MLERLSSFAARLAPWAIIGGLAYAAVFVKVDVEADAMPQPLIEQRDQFFGATDADGILWFVGQGGSTLMSDPSTEGGWQRAQLSPPLNLQGIAASDAGVLVAVGNDGRVFVRQGDGAWTASRLPVDDVGAKLLDVAFFDGAFWIVGEMGALFRGNASGDGWTRLREADDVAFNRIRRGPGGTIWIPAEFGRLLSSDDGGKHWESIELGSESLQSIAFSGERGVVVGNRGEAFATDDGGVTWALVSTPGEEHLYDVIARGEGWLAAGDRGALFAVSADGRRWQALAPEGLGKSYIARALAVGNGVVLAGRGLGLLTEEGRYRAWPDANGSTGDTP